MPSDAAILSRLCCALGLCVCLSLVSQHVEAALQAAANQVAVNAEEPLDGSAAPATLESQALESEVIPVVFHRLADVGSVAVTTAPAGVARITPPDVPLASPGSGGVACAPRQAEPRRQGIRRGGSDHGHGPGCLHKPAPAILPAVGARNGAKSRGIARRSDDRT